jgi:hypothetical protein
MTHKTRVNTEEDESAPGREGSSDLLQDAIKLADIGVDKGKPDCPKTRATDGQVVSVSLADPVATPTGQADQVQGKIDIAA